MAASKDKRGNGAGTRLVAAGRAKSLTGPFVNPPVVHASTVLFTDTAEMLSGKAPYVYGRRGTPTSRALEGAIAELEGAEGTVLCPSGLSGVSLSLLAFLDAGDHCLIPDTIYEPGRYFADTILKRLGVEVAYYDPTLTDLTGLLRPRTRVVYVESPGSLTFEVQDLRALSDQAHRAGAVVIADATWPTPLFQRPLDLGADVVVQAATKYLSGHADVLLGAVSANQDAWPRLKRAHGGLGLFAGPDDVYAALKGIRSLEVRLRRHERSALDIAGWLEGRPEVSRVLHPALPSHPQHELWKRDFTGSTGLFGFVGKGWDQAAAARFLDSLTLFGLGYSWGGYESLAVLALPEKSRTAVPWRSEGALIRLHIGLEDPEDLKADLAAALDRAREG
jgi:cystathionine beta-lyase